jgi:cytochrome o ubiquinol oxidase subunit II
MNIFDPQGPVAAADRTILIDSVAIMLAIVVPTIIAILVFAYYFRHSNRKAAYLPNFTYSGRIELVVWSIPALTVLLLAGVAWIGSHQLDPAAPVEGKGDPVRIQAVSLDWKWLFIYPDHGIATLNSLTIPAGAPVRIELTSGSVMTAFFIPQLASMIYTMNGMVTHLNLRADREGELQGVASQFSGDGFPDMLFDVHVISSTEWSNWAGNAAKSDRILNAESYRALSRQSVETVKATYRLEDPHLFDEIATQHIPAGPGPTITSDAAQSYIGAPNVR